MTVSAVDTGPRKITRRVEVNAPADELFALVADPRGHGKLDGSGTVMDTVKGPERLSDGAKFSVKMKQYGLPYRITSRVTEFTEGRVLEWRHPMGHRWRWEFKPTPDPSIGTVVTETFDYSRVILPVAKMLELTKVPAQNAAGIEATLDGLSASYAS